MFCRCMVNIGNLILPFTQFDVNTQKFPRFLVNLGYEPSMYLTRSSVLNYYQRRSLAHGFRLLAYRCLYVVFFYYP